MFAKADHVALSVRDMEKAIAFYRDVIGMEKVFDREFGEVMGRLIGVEGTKVRIVHMKLNDSVVELFDYASPVGREPVREHQQSDFGLTHIGFIVEDFWGTYKHLLAHHVE
ncbi:MAG: VOC family protein, partial [Anaerolineae bacterium]|nr:VOC family protein [Anaerolineae bacterium]